MDILWIFYGYLWCKVSLTTVATKVQLPTSLSRHQQRSVAQVRCPVDVSSCDHGTPRMCCSLSAECWNTIDIDEFSLAHFDLRIGEICG